MSETSWRIAGPAATLLCGGLQARVTFGPDRLELIGDQWSGQPSPGISVLRSTGPSDHLPLEIAEHYIRGRDLIVSYKPNGRHRITPHVSWRAKWNEQRSAAVVELILSAQTDLLDSVPTWTVTCSLPGSNRFHSSDLGQRRFEDISTEGRRFDATVGAEHLFLFRLESLGLSYAQMVHPSDFVSAYAPFAANQPLAVESVLFPEHLEKGVIRRGRICGWFMPAENDLETAVELARQFIDEPPPLTA